MYQDPNGNYPRFYGDIMLDVPGWQKGDDLPDGWRIVEMTEPPEVGEYQVLEELTPVETDGRLYQSWTVREMTADERERVDAPKVARQKLIDLGFTELEIKAISRGL